MPPTCAPLFWLVISCSLSKIELEFSSKNQSKANLWISAKITCRCFFCIDVIIDIRIAKLSFQSRRNVFLVSRNESILHRFLFLFCTLNLLRWLFEIGTDSCIDVQFLLIGQQKYCFISKKILYWSPQCKLFLISTWITIEYVYINMGMLTRVFTIRRA